MLGQNRHLNGYIFVIRIPGCMQDLTNAQEAVIYLTKLGARFIVITHDDLVDTNKYITAIFGFGLSSHTHAYVAPNNIESMIQIFQKIRRSAQPVHSNIQLVYLDNHRPYLEHAKTQGYSAHNIQTFTKDSVTNLASRIMYNNQV